MKRNYLRFLKFPKQYIKFQKQYVKNINTINNSFFLKRNLNLILSFPKNRPFTTNLITATIKTSSCDILVQKYIEKKEKIDWKRNSIFTIFGFFYLGIAQWFIFVNFFNKLFPNMQKFANSSFNQKLKDKNGIKNVFYQVFFDNFIHNPFIYFPCFYVCKEYILEKDFQKSFKKGILTYKKNFKEDNLKIIQLFIVGDIIAFAVPIWLRLPIIHSISFVWTCYLSFSRGNV